MAKAEVIKKNIYDDLTINVELNLPEVTYLTIEFEPQVIVFYGCTAYTARFICHKKRLSSVYWIDNSTGDIVSASHVWNIGWNGGKGFDHGNRR
jgi:hypothetical protein